MSVLMCCSDKQRNRIDVETTQEKIEVRSGRWLRVIHKDPAGSEGHDLLSVNLSKDDVNCWINGGVDNKVNISTEARTERTTKIVVFFIHGVGGCADVWHKQIEFFSKLGYIVVAPDILGHGGSNAPRDPPSYHFNQLSDDMFAVFDRFRSEKRNILVGHSYGCSFCTMIAAQRPRQVTKMILVSGGGPVPLHPQPCQLFCLPACILACLKPFVVWSFRRMGFHAHNSQDSVQFSDAFKVPSYVLRATMMGQRWDEGDEEFHSGLMVATLLIYGCHDNFVSLEEETHMRETIYGSTLEVIDNAGHMVMLECPDKVNDIILDFLCRDPSTRSEQLSHESNNRTGCGNTISDVHNSVSTVRDSDVNLNRGYMF